MLDLNFVRDNLPLVEEKLRQRGMNPSEALKDFGAIDAERRLAITENETLQARRNRASEEIARLKKSGQDATALIQETKELREQIQVSEKKAAESEARLREILKLEWRHVDWAQGEVKLDAGSRKNDEGRTNQRAASDALARAGTIRLAASCDSYCGGRNWWDHRRIVVCLRAAGNFLPGEDAASRPVAGGLPSPPRCVQ